MQFSNLLRACILLLPFMAEIACSFFSFSFFLLLLFHLLLTFFFWPSLATFLLLPPVFLSFPVLWLFSSLSFVTHQLLLLEWLACHFYLLTHYALLWRQIKIKRSPDEQPFKSVRELVHLNIVITKWGVYFFCTCEDGAVWHLIPRRISPCSESFLRHIGTGILCGV